MTIPLLTELPDAPSRADPANFASRGDALMTALPTMVEEINVVISELNTAIPLVEGVQAVADAAAAVTNVTQWNAATVYTAGSSCVWSPLDFLTYRRKTNGASPTDPSLDDVNWQLLLSADVVETATASATITLDAESAYTQTITPTGPGFRFILPDATTIKKRKSNHLLQNGGDYSVGVYDKGGTLRFVIPPRSSTRVSCKSTASAAGGWIFDGNGYPGLFTYFKQATGYSNTGTPNLHINVAILSATCVIYLMQNSSGHLYAQAVNPVARQEGAVTLIHAANIANKATIFRESDTIAAVFYNAAGSAAAVTAKGLTVNPATLAFDTISSPATSTILSTVGSNNQRRLVQLASGLYVCASASGIATTTKVQACSFSAGAPSWGAEDTVLTSSAGNTNYNYLEKVDATRAVVWASDASASPGRMRVIAIAGNTVSKGNELSFSLGGTGTFFDNVVLSSSQIAQIDVNSGSTNFAIRGISITSGTTLAISTNKFAVVSSVANALSDDTRHAFRLSDTEALFLCADASVGKHIIATFNGTNTPTATVNGSLVTNSVAYGVEPDGECWPQFNYSNSTGTPSFWGSFTRAGETVAHRGVLDTGANWYQDIWRTIKVSDKWLALPQTTRSPRVPVFKKVDGVVRMSGIIPFPGPIYDLHSTPAVSGNVVAFQMNDTSATNTYLCAIELVS